jgi:hypothetical protein
MRLSCLWLQHYVKTPCCLLLLLLLQRIKREMHVQEGKLKKRICNLKAPGFRDVILHSDLQLCCFFHVFLFVFGGLDNWSKSANCWENLNFSKSMVFKYEWFQVWKSSNCVGYWEELPKSIKTRDRTRNTLWDMEHDSITGTWNPSCTLSYIH